jgi:hypothetical protein
MDEDVIDKEVERAIPLIRAAPHRISKSNWVRCSLSNVDTPLKPIASTA